MNARNMYPTVLHRLIMGAALVAAPLLAGCGTTIDPGCKFGMPVPPVPVPLELPPDVELPTETDATDIDINPSDYTDWWNSLSSEDQAAWESWWDSF